jgi:hypothetical protein
VPDAAFQRDQLIVLQAEIQQQKSIINQLQQQLSFVLSFLGIVDQEALSANITEVNLTTSADSSHNQQQTVKISSEHGRLLLLLFCDVYHKMANIPNKQLDQLHPTVTGLDQLPAWDVRLGAAAFCRPISWLFERSLANSVVPQQWKSAWIQPIPKVGAPAVYPDFHPISITPVLSQGKNRSPAFPIPSPLNTTSWSLLCR